MLLTITDETLHIIIPVLGPGCRSFRTKQQAGPTKQLFLRFTSTKPFLPCVPHCLKTSPVPLFFNEWPRLGHWSLSNKKIFLDDVSSENGSLNSSQTRYVMSVWTEFELELVDAIDKSRKYRSKDIPTDLLSEVDSLSSCSSEMA